jgi:hypothetical protein
LLLPRHKRVQHQDLERNLSLALEIILQIGDLSDAREKDENTA